MKNNAYFDEMYRIGHEWSLAHRAHEELKEQIIKEKGWDSDELKAWYEEEEKMKFPFSSGANKAYRAWKYSTGDEVVMDDFCWTAERHDFIDALRQAGIRSFVVTNQSTGYPRRFLMREDSQSSNYLHSFQNKTSRIKNAYGL